MPEAVLQNLEFVRILRNHFEADIKIQRLVKGGGEPGKKGAYSCEPSKAMSKVRPG